MWRKPPPGFDDAFFVWLEEMIEVVDFQFVSRGCLRDSDCSRIEERLWFSLPEDIRRFHRRYTPWEVRHDWSDWDETTQRIRATTGINLPLVPIDNRSDSSSGYDTVAAVESSDSYRVIFFKRPTSEVRFFRNLRRYYIAEVLGEIRLSQ